MLQGFISYLRRTAQGQPALKLLAIKELLLVQNLTDLFTKELIEYQSQRLGDWK